MRVHAIALLILCLALAGCDRKKKVVNSVDVDAPAGNMPGQDSPARGVPAEGTVVCAGALKLPAGSGMLPGDLQVLSVYEEVTPNADGGFHICLPETRKPQFVFAMDPQTTNPVLLGHRDLVAGEAVDLSFESTAVGLAFLNPFMMGTPAEYRREFIRNIKEHPDFPLLVAAVESGFRTDPLHLLDDEANPELYRQAAEIAIDVWQGMNPAGKALAVQEGSSPVPWIWGGTGSTISFVNPNFVYYAADISTENPPSEVVTVNPVLQALKGSNVFAIGVNMARAVWNRSLDPLRSDPVATKHQLENGQFKVYLTKGFLREEFDWNSANGVATGKNIERAIVLMLELVGGISPTAENIAESLDAKDHIQHIAKIADAQREGDVWKGVQAGLLAVIAIINETPVVDKIVEKNKNRTYKGKPIEVNTKYFKKVTNTFGGVIKKVLKILEIINAGEHVLNKGIPFAWDLVRVEQEVQYELMHNRAQVTALRRQEPGDPLSGNEIKERRTFTLPGRAKMEMVWVPETGGGGFWLGTYEVTQKQWKAVMGTAPWSRARTDLKEYVVSGDSYPAVNISWRDAHDFIGRLNDAAGDSLYRLPTEEEWEHACRAGTRTAWSFGDNEEDLKHFAWYAGNSASSVGGKPGDSATIKRVGGKLPNPWGLHDVHGNASEWVRDRESKAEMGGFFLSLADQTKSNEKLPYDDLTDVVVLSEVVGFRLLRTAEPVARPEPEPVTRVFSLLNGAADMEFVQIEPGSFTMGSPYGEDGRDRDEGPQHRVKISKRFWLGAHEVTQDQWTKVMGTTPWQQNGRNRSNVRSNPSHPAVYISWDDAQEFIAKLNRAEGAWWYRLPTEAEWEYTCRAGKSFPSTPWSFGADGRRLDSYAWYSRNAGDAGEAYGHAVGTKLPNPWGLHDMHGNVWEWVQDWYGRRYYSRPIMWGASNDPQGPASGTNRVGRGGYFGSNAADLRSANRSYASPDAGTAAIGARLVRGDTPGEWPQDIRREEPAPPPNKSQMETFALPGGVEMEFAWIEPGTFRMGAPASEGGHGNERPVHEVEIGQGFYLGAHEVTQGQWEAVMGSNPSHYEGDDRPVERVSYEDAHEFIGRLNDAAGDSLYRLPTEAEWEYACRAGSPDPWSHGADEDELGRYAWYRGNNDPSGTKPVGGKWPNRWGLHDMHGNVWEWAQDWFDPDYYGDSPRVDPAGPAAGDGRVVRGGKFSNNAAGVRSAYRGVSQPGARNNTIGLRLLRLEAPAQAPPVEEPGTPPVEEPGTPPAEEPGTPPVEEPGTPPVEEPVTPPVEEPGTPPPYGGGAVGDEATFSLPGGPSLEMVWIEPGTFQMGSEKGHESPVHEVEISNGFWLGAYEVTQEQWQAVMGTIPWDGDGNVVDDPSHPAVHVSWLDAQDFIVRLNEAAGALWYRLPTEAEWEFACRAGTQTPWSFGDELQAPDYAWYSYTAGRAGENYAHAVGTKWPNPWGLSDMHGNVFEWVHDWYDEGYYADSPRVDPTGPATGSYRVLRGGAYAYGINDIRSAFRANVGPSGKDWTTGFRLLRLEEPVVPVEAAAIEKETFSLPGNGEMEMVWIEPGTFQMGSEKGHESPVHEVEISNGYWLGTYEVTQGQWQAVMGTTPWSGDGAVVDDPSHPAVHVSWEDAQDFIVRLNEAAGALWYRLPTEAEWEFACRAGTQTPWSFGDNQLYVAPHYAWYSYTAGRAGENYAHAVGTKWPNPWGLSDMHGNVFEWVHDWYDEGYYADSPRVDPTGPATGSYRVLRGGAYAYGINDIRSAFRANVGPSGKDWTTGFRLLRLEEPVVPVEAAAIEKETFSLPGNGEMEMVWIEPGTFQMGSEKGHESPVHEVEISNGYWLGTYEVTQGQWQAVMGTTPWSGDGAVVDDPSHPAVHVSWEDAQDFIVRLNEAAGALWYRLPTEAEWEFACRAGTQTPWSFGDNQLYVAPHYAWYSYTAGRAGENYAHAVGTKWPNPWGLSDMHGNVFEWVHDWYDEGYYADSPRVDPTGPATGSYRVLRGGAYAYGINDIRSAFRANVGPSGKDWTTGFRLLRLEEPVVPVEAAAIEKETFSLPGNGEMEMVWIEPGTFQMGSEKGHESPVHEVEISNGYWLGTYEVTQGQWQAVMGTTPWSGDGAVVDDPSHPAVHVSWEDAQDFIVRLNEAAGALWYRLPTEAEWEFACRAGTQTPWSFGDNQLYVAPHYAWYSYTAGRAGENYAHAVGTKWPNPWGLSDMHGNVFEWVHDWYDEGYYADSPRVDPTGPATGSYRVLRGGAYAYGINDIRSAFRANVGPSGKDWTTGFRLLRLEEPVVPVEAAAIEKETFSLPGNGEMEMVWIEPGTFQMGSEKGHESPVHEVEISNGYWLGTYEVTQGQWQAVMGTTPWSGDGAVVDDPSHPAVHVSWEDAQDFIVRLNEAAGALWYRLPTEAEWEFACRAGTQTPWSFGDNQLYVAPHYAWYSYTAGRAGENYAHAVGTKWPNPWGLSDMHGNVFEWVHDWYDEGYYADSPRVDPTGPATGSYRVLRGGAYAYGINDIRSAFRANVGPSGKDWTTGFRLLRVR